MNAVKRAKVCALAIAALVSSTGAASAQNAPTLNVQVQSSQVTLQWSGLAGAQGYTVTVGSTSGGSDIAVVNLPATITFVQVNAPNGIYHIRVRGFAGSNLSDYSNEVVAQVGQGGGGPCVPPQAPNVTASVGNGAVTLNWNGVGAIGYLVQWSRVSGGTELQEQTAATSHSKFVGINGEYFARVVAVSACGTATSREVSFRIEGVTRRHLSPQEILGILMQTQAEFPRAFQTAHTNSSERYDFMILAGRRLYQASGGTVGLNWRRAVPGDLSADGITVENPADGLYYFADVIAGAGGPNPVVWYEPPFHSGALLRDVSGTYAPWGFANPMTLRTNVNYGPAGGW